MINRTFSIYQGLPSSFNLVPLSSISIEVKKRNSDLRERNLLSLSYGRIIRKDIDGDGGLLPESFDGYNIIQDNDIVLRLTDLQNDKRSLRTGIAKEEGIITSAYTTLRPVGVDPRWLAYTLHSYDIQKVFYSLGSGLRQSMNYSNLKELSIHLPPIEEQRRIADYLDEQIAIIDQVIVTKLQLVEKYREIYDSYRHRAVIGASNKNKMPTTLQWIPEVPDSWNKLPLRSSSSWGKGRDSGRLDVLYCGSYPGEFPVYSGQTSNEGVFANIDTFDFDTDALCVLMSTVGALAGSTRLITGKFSLSQNCAILFPKIEVITAEYLNYLWPTIWSVLKSKIPSDMQPSVRFSDLSEIWIYAPTVGEQSKIVEKISGFALSNDVLLRTTEKSIEKLSEYKTSLITAAVTGQFDVTTGRSVA